MLQHAHGHVWDHNISFMTNPTPGMPTKIQVFVKDRGKEVEDCNAPVSISEQDYLSTLGQDWHKQYS